LLLRFLLIIQRVQQFVAERRGAWTGSFAFETLVCIGSRHA
jgi:hypothetical protein